MLTVVSSPPAILTSARYIGGIEFAADFEAGFRRGCGDQLDDHLKQGRGHARGARKTRTLELKAGHKARRGQKGSAYAYNIKGSREQERRFVEQPEAAYTCLVAGLPEERSQCPRRARAQSEERRSRLRGKDHTAHLAHL